MLKRNRAKTCLSVGNLYSAEQSEDYSGADISEFGSGGNVLSAEITHAENNRMRIFLELFYTFFNIGRKMLSVAVNSDYTGLVGTVIKNVFESRLHGAALSFVYFVNKESYAGERRCFFKAYFVFLIGPVVDEDYIIKALINQAFDCRYYFFVRV